METITIILGLVMLVFGILQIILFFKVWGMTNDVNEIKNLLSNHTTRIQSQKNETTMSIPNSNSNDWQIGSCIVHLATDEQYKIVRINPDGTIYARKNNLISGTFRSNEVMPWDEYIAKQK